MSETYTYFAAVLDNSLGVVVDPSHFLSLGPLLVALAIALLAVRRHGSRYAGTRQSDAPHSKMRQRMIRPLTWRQTLAVLFPRRIFLHRSALLDYAVFAINEGVLFFLTIGAVLTPAGVSESLLTLAGRDAFLPAGVEAGIAERVVATVYLMLLWDFAASYAHYLKHKVPVLWEFHKVHHSAEVMTPVTALRRHPVDTLFGALVTTMVLGAGTAAWILVFGRSPLSFGFFGVIAGIYLWRLLGYNLRHTHVWISYGDFWNRVFISPAQHQVHHSVDPRHYDTNFGHILSCWDGLFGTLYLPGRNERVTFGIAAAEMPDYRSLPAVYFIPFAKAAKLMLKTLRSAPAGIRRSLPGD